MKTKSLNASLLATLTTDYHYNFSSRLSIYMYCIKCYYSIIKCIFSIFFLDVIVLKSLAILL